jgi:hypothetical protein
MEVELGHDFHIERFGHMGLDLGSGTFVGVGKWVCMVMRDDYGFPTI